MCTRREEVFKLLTLSRAPLSLFRLNVLSVWTGGLIQPAAGGTLSNT